MEKRYETERLILRTVDSKDAFLVLDYYIRNKEFLEQYEGIKERDYFTLEKQKYLIDMDNKLKDEGKKLRLWIYKKDEENKIIGTLAFSEIIRGILQSCFLGYKLDEKELNKGYMTEAIKKAVDIIFTEYRLHRIEANVIPSNTRSIRVLEKCGFHNEGLAKKYLSINGKWQDHIHMAILNEALEN